jgi:hypothetical protein
LRQPAIPTGDTTGDTIMDHHGDTTTSAGTLFENEGAYREFCGLVSRRRAPMPDASTYDAKDLQIPASKVCRI